MRKITDFIVEKRNYLLITFSILAIISVFISTKVNINYDMAKYLPSTSSTRQGLDIMESEFAENTSTLNLMLKDLNDDAIQEANAYLTNLDNVTDVTQEEKDDYVLFTLTIDGEEDSQEVSDVYDAVTTQFAESLVDTSGNATNYNKSVLPFYIIALAVGSATIILIIMSESYIEPFLFLVTIFIAVMLNSGTNIIFPSVSNITSSIAAILQMALSMDYSIMLMNRYRQERAQEKDKVKAMKNAMSHAFQSISSSSVTTIVGLLALIFMSFTIGRDLGLVLAKGVLLSLVSIFTCLPGLILLCDNLIQKTSKKCPIIKLDFLGKISFKVRHLASIMFIIIFVVSFLLKGNLGIVYTNSGADEIDQVFTLNNQMAIIYPNSEEEKVAEYCQELGENDQIDELLCYGNTINETLTYDELNPQLQDLGSEITIDDYLTKIIYYTYYHNQPTSQVTLANLIKFIKSDVYANPEMASHLTESMRKDIDRLQNFVDESLIDQKHSAKEIATMLNISENNVQDLLTYYHSKHLTTNITLPEFISFLNQKVLPNSQYNASFDTATKENLRLLANFTNQELLTKSLNAQELANLFGLDTDLVQNILLLASPNTQEYTIEEIVSTIIYLKQNTTYLANVDVDTTSIEMLANNSILMSNPTKFSKEALAELMQEDVHNINFIYNLIGLVSKENPSLSPVEFVNFLLTNQKAALDTPTISKLTLLNTVMQLTLNNQSLSYTQVASILNIPSDKTALLYSLYDTQVKSYQDKLSYREFINFLLTDVAKNPTYNQSFDAATITRLNSVNAIINAALNHTTYTSTQAYQTLSPLADDLDPNLIELVYIYYGSEKEYNPDYRLTIEEFVNYLNTTILNDERFQDFIDEERRNDIINSQDTIKDAKELLVGQEYSRLVINSKLTPEGEKTFNFIESLEQDLQSHNINGFIAGDSPMAYEMSKTFQGELNLITILTMIFIFVVVAFTFKSLLIPIVLVLLIQCAVFLTMGILSFGGDVYFISILIVQSILMGATIDYAILYTSYYEEARATQSIKDSLISAYNNSIHTITTSASILIIVTLIVGYFASAITAKICMTISEGSICSTLLILLLLPAVLASCDKFLIKKK